MKYFQLLNTPWKGSGRKRDLKFEADKKKKKSVFQLKYATPAEEQRLAYFKMLSFEYNHVPMHFRSLPNPSVSKHFFAAVFFGKENV